MIGIVLVVVAVIRVHHFGEPVFNTGSDETDLDIHPDKFDSIFRWTEKRAQGI